MLTSIRQEKSLVISLLLFLILGTVFFPSAGRDDDYIAFWSADSLLQFGEIINYNGERIEQGSSPGHILLLTVASAVSRLPAPYIAVPVSIASGLMLLLLLNSFNSFFDRRAVNYALLITATAFPFTYWSFSGLETSTYTFALTFFCILVSKISRNRTTVREYLFLFPVLLALQLLRPESFFVIGLSIGILWILKVARETRESGMASTLFQKVFVSDFTRFASFTILVDIAAFISLACFRYFYFGSIFPQPVISKVSGVFPGLHSGLRIIPGGKYIFEFFSQNFILMGAVAASVSIVLLIFASRNSAEGASQQDGPADILIAVSISQFTFILLSGPDWMEGFRFIVPIVPALAMLAGIFFYRNCKKRRNIEIPQIIVLVLIQSIGFGLFVANSSSAIPLWATRNNIVEKIPGAQDYSWFTRANTHHLRDIPLTEELNNTIESLKSVIDGRPIVILSYQAGFVMYHVAKEHFGAIQFIDLAALVDDTLTSCAPLRKVTRKLRNESAKKYGLGHMDVSRHLIQKSNTAETCFSPRPDIIYTMGGEMRFSPEFQELGYELAFDNGGTIALETGNKTFYGQYLVDRDLFQRAGLDSQHSKISVEYQAF